MFEIKRYVMAIDPGNEYSAYAIVDMETYKPIEIGKKYNREVMDVIERYNDRQIKDMLGASSINMSVIEMVSSYGMIVGQTVFDTCVWIGRYYSMLVIPLLMMRKEVKLQLCGVTSAKDGNIKQALVDRFARGEPNDGKGTKNNPGWFYGFKADIWQAYALAVAFIDKEKSGMLPRCVHFLQGEECESIKTVK